MDTTVKRLLLSAGIGLGVAVSGVSLYLLLKPEDEGLAAKDYNQKVRQNITSVLTIRVPKAYVGAVIGRGGEHIKQIQTETKTRINFDDSNAANGSDNGLKDMRILVIRGTAENTAKAEMAINTIIREQSKIVTKKFSVDTNAIGYIIGRNGDNIRGLCERSGAKIKVDRNSKKSNAIMTWIWITGTDEQIEEAELLINEEIAQNQNFSRNRSQNYKQKQLIDYKLNAIEDIGTNNRIDFDNYFAKLDQMNENQYLEVFVSAVKSPDKFYVQIAGAGAQQLDHLMEESTDFYEIEDNRISFKPVKRLKVGDIVAVPYQFDEHWYRARVLSIEDQPYCLEDSNVGIFYLDYGDEAQVKYNQICDLKDELLRRLPFQAIECSLSGLRPKHNNWTEEAVNQLKELSHMALWETLYAKVIDIHIINGKRNKYFIELIDKNAKIKSNINNTNTSGDDDWDDTSKVQAINIGEELIRRNFAVPDVQSND